MKNLIFLLVFISLTSCTDQECYECLDYHAYSEASIQFIEEYTFSTPNFAVAGQEAIPLLCLGRFDNATFALINPRLELKGENSEVFFEGDASSLISSANHYEVPPSLFFIGDELQQGLIEYELSFFESQSNLPFSIKGVFLLVSCETYLNREVKNQDDCRFNFPSNAYEDDFASRFNYGC